jgi:hypothetical protein
VELMDLDLAGRTAIVTGGTTASAAVSRASSPARTRTS